MSDDFYSTARLEEDVERDALRALLRELYAYTIELEGRMSVWVATRPHMAAYPGTQEERNALGERVRAALAEKGTET